MNENANIRIPERLTDPVAIDRTPDPEIIRQNAAAFEQLALKWRDSRTVEIAYTELNKAILYMILDFFDCDNSSDLYYDDVLEAISEKLRLLAIKDGLKRLVSTGALVQATDEQGNPVFRDDGGYYGSAPVYVLSPLQLNKDSGEEEQDQEILQAYAEHSEGLTRRELGKVLDPEEL
jgi:hypothetical protein